MDDLAECAEMGRWDSCRGSWRVERVSALPSVCELVARVSLAADSFVGGDVSSRWSESCDEGVGGSGGEGMVFELDAPIAEAFAVSISSNLPFESLWVCDGNGGSAFSLVEACFFSPASVSFAVVNGVSSSFAGGVGGSSLATLLSRTSMSVNLGPSSFV